MKIHSFAALALCLLILGHPATTASLAGAAARTAPVSNANDSGPGSFRDAVNRANAEPSITRIAFTPAGLVIALHQTVLFTGAQALVIEGHGGTLDGAGLGPASAAFRSIGGGDLTISRLVVRNATAEGIDVQVPAGAAGTVYVTLSRVEILDNLGHGVLINDQEDSSTTDGVQPNPNGSAASVMVSVTNSRFVGNGYSVSDRDGLRVNEGGEGDLALVVKQTVASDNAADGIEVDERGAGDVLVDVRTLQVVRNGKFDPDDLDDGFDIDEYDDGSVLGLIVSSIASDNYEEGLDFNENNAGDLRVNLVRVEASGNREEGVDYEEDDDFAGGGDLVTVMSQVVANGNGADGGDAGLKIREKGAGNLDALLTRIDASENVIGGVSVREDAAGNLVSLVERGFAEANGGRGIDFDENADGTLTAVLLKGRALNNVDVDLRADQQSPGTGSFDLYSIEFGTTGGNVTPAAH